MHAVSKQTVDATATASLLPSIGRRATEKLPAAPNSARYSRSLQAATGNRLGGALSLDAVARRRRRASKVARSNRHITRRQGTWRGSQGEKAERRRLRYPAIEKHQKNNLRSLSPAMR